MASPCRLKSPEINLAGAGNCRAQVTILPGFLRLGQALAGHSEVGSSLPLSSLNGSHVSIAELI